MKFLKYVLIWLGVLLVLTSVAGYVYVRVEGKAFFEKKMTKFFGQPTTIEDVRYLVPTGIRFHQLKIKNVLEADDVHLHLKLPLLLEKRFVIARLELINPVFHLVRHEEKEIDFGGTYLNKQEEKFRTDKKASQRKIEGVIIDFLSVSNGRFEILDLAVSEPLKYDVGSVEGKAMKVSYPLKDQNIKFDIEGEILNAGEKEWLKKGFFDATGWINWPARGLSASVEFESEGGILGNIDLIGEKNIVQAKGKFKVAPVVFKEEGVKINGSQDDFAEDLLGAFQNFGSQLEADFRFETKMDSFKLDVVKFDGLFCASERKKSLDGLNPTVLFGIGQEDKVQN